MNVYLDSVAQDKLDAMDDAKIVASVASLTRFKLPAGSHGELMLAAYVAEAAKRGL